MLTRENSRIFCLFYAAVAFSWVQDPFWMLVKSPKREGSVSKHLNKIFYPQGLDILIFFCNTSLLRIIFSQYVDQMIFQMIIIRKTNQNSKKNLIWLSLIVLHWMILKMNMKKNIKMKIKKEKFRIWYVLHFPSSQSKQSTTKN